MPSRVTRLAAVRRSRAAVRRVGSTTRGRPRGLALAVSPPQTTCCGRGARTRRGARVLLPRRSTRVAAGRGRAGRGGVLLGASPEIGAARRGRAGLRRVRSTVRIRSGGTGVLTVRPPQTPCCGGGTRACGRRLLCRRAAGLCVLRSVARWAAAACSGCSGLRGVRSAERLWPPGVVIFAVAPP